MKHGKGERRILKVSLLDPFGTKLGEGLVSIDEATWYRDLPADVQRAQIRAMTDSRYGQVDAKHPPFQFSVEPI